MDSKTRAKLRGMANKLKIIYRVGKEGITKDLINGINDYLYAHELIKIYLSKSQREEFLKEIEKNTCAHVIETKGNTLVLYKYSTKDDIIHIL